MSRIGSLYRLARYGFAFQRPASPLMVIFPVTTRCDMRCRHCGDDVWGDPANDLPLAEIEKFSRSLGPSNDLALGGGSPFQRDDLPEICELFVRNSGVRNLGIASNGFATERICAAVVKILEKCPGTSVGLSLSLDGFQATHDSIRVPGSYERVMETAHRFSALREEYKHFSFFFNATINDVNWRELPSLAEYVHEKFQTFLDFNILTGNPRDPSMGLPSEEEIAATIDGIYAARKTCPMPASLVKTYRDVLLRTKTEGRQIVPCRAGSLIALVDANGDVRACPLLPVLGNLRSQPFREIWHGEAAKSQHRSIIRGECSCDNNCYVISSLNHYWKMPVFMLGQKLRRREPSNCPGKRART